MLQCMAFAQDSTSWEPQKNITGYIAMQGEYFDGLKYTSREYGFAIPEAGLLASFKPIKRLTVNTVFVYRPTYEFEQMLNEVNGEYEFADLFKVKIGRFLTPLSPVNTYYYAPVNTSATLPMLITNHEFFPLNMDAICLSGKVGEDFKIDYNVFGGGFKNALWMKTGTLGFFGDEYNYFQKVIANDTSNATNSGANAEHQIGGGAHLGISYRDNVNIGGGVFNSKEGMESSLPMGDPFIYIKKFSYGGHAMFKFANIKLAGEYWKTKVSMDFLGMKIESYWKGAFAELSYSIDKFTPYVRGEYHSVQNFTPEATEYYRYTGGINFKPLFETSFKLEYVYYKFKSEELGGLIGTAIFSL